MKTPNKYTSQHKHILMITNDTTFAYNLRREILQQFIADGHQVTLVSEILSFKKEFETIGCKLIDVNTSRHGTSIIRDIGLFLRYFSILRREHPDLVFTNNIKPNVYAGLACRILHIRYIPNITGLGTPVENPGLLQKLTVFLYRIGIKNAASVFFQNTENEHFFRTRNMLSPKSSVVLLPGSGVNLSSHPALPYPGGEQIHFLFVARILKEKGIDLYLSAARQIKAKHPNAIFHICGGCDDKNYIDTLQAAELDGIILYHGQQNDMAPYFLSMHCLVHPSYYPEGMSNVLLEAAASARPIIATDRSGCRETVEADVSGYLIPIQNESALVKALEDFLSLSQDQRKAMGLAGRAKVEKEFDRQIVVQKYIDEVANL